MYGLDIGCGDTATKVLVTHEAMANRGLAMTTIHLCHKRESLMTVNLEFKKRITKCVTVLSSNRDF